MPNIYRHSEREVWVQSLQKSEKFRTPFGKEEFSLLLLVLSDEFSSSERIEVTDAIVAAGCRFAVCAGVNCSEWRYSIDISYIQSDPDFSPPEERFLMTTWHEDEALQDVVEYFALNTSFDYYDSRKYLVVIVGQYSNEEVENLISGVFKDTFG